jgi:hypothetical protein
MLLNAAADAATQQKAGRAGGASQNTFTISMQYVEIADDRITDLFDPGASEIKVQLCL